MNRSSKPCKVTTTTSTHEPLWGRRDIQTQHLFWKKAGSSHIFSECALCSEHGSDFSVYPGVTSQRVPSSFLPEQSIKRFCQGFYPDYGRLSAHSTCIWAMPSAFLALQYNHTVSAFWVDSNTWEQACVRMCFATSGSRDQSPTLGAQTAAKLGGGGTKRSECPKAFPFSGWFVLLQCLLVVINFSFIELWNFLLCVYVLCVFGSIYPTILLTSLHS